jgi:hypothetical protein
MKLTVRPLTTALWPQLEELSGRVGACNGRWCAFTGTGFKTVALPAPHRSSLRRALERVAR